MNHSGHVYVNQAHKLEVAGSRESYRKGGLSFHQRTSAHARGAIEAGSGRRTTDLERRTYLNCWARFEKGHRMDLVGVKLPGDAVARVNPDFIGKKGQRLVSQVLDRKSVV